MEYVHPADAESGGSWQDRSSNLQPSSRSSLGGRLTKLGSLVEKKKLPRFWETKGKRQTWRWTGGGAGGMSDGKNGCFRSQWKLAQS